MLKQILTTEKRRHGKFFSLCLPACAALACATAGRRASVVFLLLLLRISLPAEEIVQDLDAGWQFHEAGTKEFMAAVVPGTVHTDLLANKKIPDPFLGTNEAQVQWVETKTWEYTRTFDCDKKLWKQKNKSLIFDGLDTYASVYLNDSLIVTGEDMFRTYNVDVSKIIRRKNNRLRIVFHPASELIEKNRSQSEIRHLPGGDRVFIRKAQYQFGWDWAPRLVTCGIWKPVRLEGWSGFDICDVSIQTESLHGDSALMALTLPLKGIPKGKLKIEVYDNDYTYLRTTIIDEKPTLAQTLIQLNFIVPKARLWWCNGMGKPNLYHFHVVASCGKRRDEELVTTGIRTIQLLTENDDTSPTFQFILNGQPVFIKGANWVPCDYFLPRTSHDQRSQLLTMAQHVNMNMLRVWGGGVYESDDFYNLCDQLGLLVWQDFTFACGMYPVDAHFRNEVENEARDNVVRLCSHPSLALWCGNNENSEGWENWGWKTDSSYSKIDRMLIENGNNEIFADHALLENICHLCTPGISYWPSSPSTGWGHAEAYQTGDVHYWGVWWGMEPFSAYDTHVGRFVSEFGFQAMPAFSTLQKFAPGENLSLENSAIRAHQKHPKGFETIGEYMARDYPVPKNLEDYAYVSQVMQRDGISRAIEAQRRAMPYCMGSLFWQLDDCWPVTSWSAIDYYHQPKLLWNALENLYAPVMVSVAERNDSVLIYLVNEDTINHNGVLGFQWMTLDGLPVRTSLTRTTAERSSSTVALAFSKKLLLDTLKPQNGVLNVLFNYEGNRAVSARHYFANTKSLALKKDPGIAIDVGPRGSDQAYSVTIRTVSLAKNVYLSIPGADEHTWISENGFDLLPGETKEIRISCDLTREQLQEKLKVQTMNALVQ